MKYYFPTSTLNFDAIYSSMSIMPPRYYCEEAIWFSRYYKTDVDLSDDIFVLYSYPVGWEIGDDDSENYPMLVELESALVATIQSHIVHITLPSGVSCIASNVPIPFDADALLSGNVKFLFRNEKERRSILTRASIGVSECKVAGAFNNLGIDISRGVFPDEIVELSSMRNEVLDFITTVSLKFNHKEFEVFERRDRQWGAEAGFLAGKWVRSIRDGYCLDCFRKGMDYNAWVRSLPEAFANIINMLCGMVGFRWDVNREAIVDFCTKCWKECFEVVKNDGEPRLEQWHDVLRKIARSHMDVTFGYPVAEIKDCYMQALACFVNSGRKHSLIVKSICQDNVVMPELALALYGALVGYSVFSRVVFEKRSYDITPPPPPPPPPPTLPPPPPPTLSPQPSWATKVIKWLRDMLVSFLPQKDQKKPGVVCHRRECVENLVRTSNSEADFLQKLPMIDGFGERTNAFKALSKVIQNSDNSNYKESELPGLFSGCDGQAESNAARPERLLVDDRELIAAIKADFADEQFLSIKVSQFIKEYQPGGFFYKRQDSRVNPDVIDHLIKWLNSSNPRCGQYKFSSPDKEGKFVRFLEERYNCKRVE